MVENLCQSVDLTRCKILGQRFYIYIYILYVQRRNEEFFTIIREQ